MSRLISFYNNNPLNLTAGERVLLRQVLDDVDPPVELRVLENRGWILERDPARRHPFLVRFIRDDGDPAETAGFPTEAEAMAFAESAIAWNEDEDFSDPAAWPAWCDDARWEPTEPFHPDPDDERWYLASRLEARDVA